MREILVARSVKVLYETASNTCGGIVYEALEMRRVIGGIGYPGKNRQHMEALFFV